jgi:hypothetical protein
MAENRLLRQRRETETLSKMLKKDQPEMSPYHSMVHKPIKPLDPDKYLAPLVDFGLSVAPGSGEAMSLRDAWQSSGRGGQALMEGRFGDMASEYSNSLAALLGAVPGVGVIARGTRKGAAWMDRNMPKGINRLVDAMYPSDPKNTFFSGAGPTAKTPNHTILDDYKYVRRTKGDNPDTGVGYMMFLDSESVKPFQDWSKVDIAASDLESYGKNVWLGKPLDPIRSEDLPIEDVYNSLKDRDLLPYYGDDYGQATMDDIARILSPSDIVNSAQFWDNPELVEALWDDILEPLGHRSVLTPDGMISFDPSGVKPYR